MNQTKPNKTTSEPRRKLLACIAAGSGVILAGKSFPDAWVHPAINSVMLPAHAQTSATVYAIGDTGPAGGIVFNITNNGLNGMEAAPSDQTGGPDAAWGCEGTVTGATGTAIGDGAANTMAILGGCADPGTAAELASNFSNGGFSDWFLPSLDELNEMYTQLHVNALGGFLGTYWSSSEFDASSAFLQAFLNNGGVGNNLKSLMVRVRAVRNF